MNKKGIYIVSLFVLFIALGLLFYALLLNLDGAVNLGINNLEVNDIGPDSQNIEIKRELRRDLSPNEKKIVLKLFNPSDINEMNLQPVTSKKQNVLPKKNFDTIQDLTTLGHMEVDGKIRWGFTDSLRKSSFFIAEGEIWGPWLLKEVTINKFIFIKEGKEYELSRQ